MDDDVILLVKQTFETDEIGNAKPVEEARQVFCKKKSASRDEFFRAGQQGLSSKYMFVTHPSNYEGEEVLIFENERLGIYRTYKKNDDELEIYAGYKVGESIEQK